MSEATKTNSDEPVGAQNSVVVHKVFGERPNLSDLHPTAIQSNQREEGDDWESLYAEGLNGNTVLAPPYDPCRLMEIAHASAILNPCITTMVTNVDGTGYEIKPPEGEEESSDELDAKIEGLRGIFDDCWPGTSFLTERRKLRRDIEEVGYGFLEVIRNLSGEIVFIRHASAKHMRLLKSDKPMPVQMTVNRNGKESTVTVMRQFRRFVQKISNKPLYFKEFGAELVLNKFSGKWEGDETKDNSVQTETGLTEDGKIKPGARASEILYFTKIKDVHSPYGVPAWVHATPSVMGARKAEETNLEYFESGGVPPMLVLVQGGSLAETTVKALNEMLSGKSTFKHRGMVLEATSATGTLAAGGGVRITVERFGSERQNDSMFEMYDAKCEERVRRQWRIPPILVGKAEDYNFATAYASYTVAEAQVFKPERDEFDEVVTKQLLPALGFAGFRFVSNPLTVQDIQIQIEALGLIKDDLEREERVERVSHLAHLGIDPDKVKDEPDPSDLPPTPPPQAPAPVTPGTPQPTPSAPPTPKSDKEFTRGVIVATEVIAKIDQGHGLSDCIPYITSLNKEDAAVFKDHLTKHLVGDEIIGGDITKLSLVTTIMSLVEG